MKFIVTVEAIDVDESNESADYIADTAEFTVEVEAANSIDALSAAAVEAVRY